MRMKINKSLLHVSLSCILILFDIFGLTQHHSHFGDQRQDHDGRSGAMPSLVLAIKSIPIDMLPFDAQGMFVALFCGTSFVFPVFLVISTLPFDTLGHVASVWVNLDDLTALHLQVCVRVLCVVCMCS